MNKDRIKKNAPLWGHREVVYTPKDLDEHMRRFKHLMKRNPLCSLIYYQSIINFYALKASEMDLKIKEARDNF